MFFLFVTKKVGERKKKFEKNIFLTSGGKERKSFANCFFCHQFLRGCKKRQPLTGSVQRRGGATFAFCLYVSLLKKIIFGNFFPQPFFHQSISFMDLKVTCRGEKPDRILVVSGECVEPPRKTDLHGVETSASSSYSEKKEMIATTVARKKKPWKKTTAAPVVLQKNERAETSTSVYSTEPVTTPRATDPTPTVCSVQEPLIEKTFFVDENCNEVKKSHFFKNFKNRLSFFSSVFFQKRKKFR